MNLKLVAITFCVCAFVFAGVSQVRIERALSGKIKNKDILADASDKKTVLVEQFTLFFRTQHSFEEPSMGMMLQARLDIDPKLAQEITNDAYAYLKDAFSKKGYVVQEVDKATFMNNNDVKKADKKGEKWLLNDTSFSIKQKKAEDGYLAVHAAGVNFCPIIRRTIIGAFDTAAASTVAFIEVINFADPLSTIKRGRYAGSPLMAPGLMLDSAETMCGTGGFGYWNAKLKGGSVSFPSNSDIRWDGYSWLASTTNLEEPNTQLWHPQREEFKKAVLELSKAQTDQYIEEYLKAITTAP